MKIKKARIYSIHIPFTWEITHGMATRSACDSFIIEIESDAGMGYGEALFRDYVSGSLSETTGNPDRAILRRNFPVRRSMSTKKTPAMGQIRRPVTGWPYKRGETSSSWSIPITSIRRSSFRPWPLLSATGSIPASWDRGYSAGTP